MKVLVVLKGGEMLMSCDHLIIRLTPQGTVDNNLGPDHFEGPKALGAEMDYRFHAAHLDRGLTIHEAVPGGFNRAGEGL